MTGQLGIREGEENFLSSAVLRTQIIHIRQNKAYTTYNVVHRTGDQRSSESDGKY